MLIAKPGDVYQIQPGLSPRSRYTEAEVSSQGLPFSSSRAPSLSLSLSGSHSQFSLCKTVEYSNSVVLGKSAINANPTAAASPFPFTRKIREPIPRSSSRMPRKFHIIGPIRSSNNQCQVLEINTRRDLIHLDSPRTIYLTRCVGLPPGSICCRLKIRFIRRNNRRYHDNWLTFNGSVQLYFRLLTITVRDGTTRCRTCIIRIVITIRR